MTLLNAICARTRCPVDFVVVASESACSRSARAAPRIAGRVEHRATPQQNLSEALVVRRRRVEPLGFAEGMQSVVHVRGRGLDGAKPQMGRRILAILRDRPLVRGTASCQQPDGLLCPSEVDPGSGIVGMCVSEFAVGGDRGIRIVQDQRADGPHAQALVVGSATRRAPDRTVAAAVSSPSAHRPARCRLRAAAHMPRRKR